MKLSKKKEKELIAKKISNAALITFFLLYLIVVPISLLEPDQSIISTIEVIAVIINVLAINRYIGLGLSIYSYIKYKTNYSKKVMILLIVLQIISIIAFIWWASTVDFGIDG